MVKDLGLEPQAGAVEDLDGKNHRLPRPDQTFMIVSIETRLRVVRLPMKQKVCDLFVRRRLLVWVIS